MLSQIRRPLFCRVPNIAGLHSLDHPVVPGQENLDFQLRKPEQGPCQHAAVGSMEIESADRIVCINHIPWNEHLLATIIQPNTSSRMSRYVENIPGQTAHVEFLPFLQFPVHLEFEVPGFETVLTHAHGAKHLHAVDASLVPLFDG